MIVTADSGSLYEPNPRLSYEWDPDKSTLATLRVNGTHAGYPASIKTASSNTQNGNGHLPLELGPHPADPHSTILPASPINTIASASTASETVGPRARREDSYGQDIWVYAGTGGYVCQYPFTFRLTSFLPPVSPFFSTFTFWRFMIRIPLTDHEMEITYRINNGQVMNFYIPGRNQNMRWAAHSVSCSATVPSPRMSESRPTVQWFFRGCQS
jgi:hypothetical protein